MPKFQIIVADPPWYFTTDQISMSDVKRGAKANYNTIPTADLKTLPISELADPEGCLLALWVPSSLLPEGLELMQAYGFTMKQTYIWVKTKIAPLESLKKPIKDVIKITFGLESITSSRITKVITQTIEYMHKTFDLNQTLAFNMGRIFRQTHEICLLGINNNGVYKQLANKSQRSVSFAVNQGHSIKPEHLQDSLDKMFPKADKIELFARRSRAGWTCIGNQAPDTIGEDIRDSLAKLLTTEDKQCSNF